MSRPHFLERRRGFCRLLGAAGALLLPAILLAQPKPIRIEVVSPNLGALTRFLPAQRLPTETSGGWPLTVRLTASNRDLLGIGTRFTPVFPEGSQTGFLVFADPDGCHSWIPPVVLAPGPCFHAPQDETYVEFTPTVNRAGVTGAGNPERLIHLTDFGGGGRPAIFTNAILNPTPVLTPVGPFAGGPDTTQSLCLPGYLDPVTGAPRLLSAEGPVPVGGVCGDGFLLTEVPTLLDGYGYGASAALPGLVVLSDAGVGLVLDANFNFPSGPLQARNLAGFLNLVAYELDDVSKQTNILATMNVPGGLFNPLVLADTCVGIPSSDPPTPNQCQGIPIVRVDGGPSVSRCLFCQDFADFLNQKIITVRIFVVNGTAPDILSDLDGDGKITAKDAALAGLQLLSGEEVVRFKIFHQEELPALFFDFDGNGDPSGPIVLPAGGGGLTPPPR
jgi:hypothetical protein